MTATRKPDVPADAALSPAAEELGQAFKGLTAAMRRLRGRESRTHEGVSDAQYHLLFGLRDQDELSTGELAGLAELSAATVTQMLEGLAVAGLVRRVRSQKDRRVVLTSLTERGHALLEARHAQFAPRWSAVIAQFSDEELQTAAAVIGELRTMFCEIANSTD